MKSAVGGIFCLLLGSSWLLFQFESLRGINTKLLAPATSPTLIAISKIMPSRDIELDFIRMRTAIAQNSATSIKRYSCPTDIETLTSLMLRDLPSYANRISSSSNRITSPTGNYVILAGKAEFAPLTLGPGEYTPAAPVEGEVEPKQIFFTTLERQYSTNRVGEIQQYHWLFLTQTNSGWRFVMMFSQTGPYPAGRPPTAPRDSSNGIIGRAIQIWLRDCRAGVIRPL